MLILKGFKYRIYPNPEQEVLIRKTFGCCRWMWNRMLSDKQEHYTTYHESINITPAMYKGEFEWLKEVDSLALANVQLNLQTAYKNFFSKKGCGFPKFKSKKDNHQSYTTNNLSNSIRITDGKHIRLPKLGGVRIKLHRQLPSNGKIKSATISRTPTMKYYISILVEYDNEIQQKPVNLENSIGVDFSMHSFYVDNQGNECGYPEYYRKSQKKLAREQRRLSRKKQGSNNYEKQRRKVALVYEKSANQRNDWLSKTSRTLANQYDIVFFEDIDMKNMSRCLNFGKTVHDQGFGTFRTMLDYKLKEDGYYGIYKIDKWFPSSKTCRHCGSINKNLTLKDRVWICPDCGEIIDRDVNAAINIRNKGIADLSA